MLSLNVKPSFPTNLWLWLTNVVLQRAKGERTFYLFKDNMLLYSK